MDDEELTVWCGNLPSEMDEELLFELFLQVAPLKKVRIPKDKNGKCLNYGFVIFKHTVSVPYAIEMFHNLKLYDKNIIVRSRAATQNGGNKKHQPQAPTAPATHQPFLTGMYMGQVGVMPFLQFPPQILLPQQHEFYGKERPRYGQRHDKPYHYGSPSHSNNHRSSSRSRYDNRSQRYRH